LRLRQVGGVLADLPVFLTSPIYRRWHLHWGTTPDGVLASMPGDDRFPKAQFRATRAITIASPPELVWPWLVQMGCMRAGWYSHDVFDNLGRPSATTIEPALQDLQVGQWVPMSPKPPPTEPTAFRVDSFETDRWELHVVREAVAEESTGRTRDQDLPTVPGAREPRTPVDRRSEVVAVTLARFARVDAGSHAQRDLAGGLAQLQLQVEDGVERVLDLGEGDREAVAGGREDVAATRLDGVPNAPVVFCQCGIPPRGTDPRAPSIPPRRCRGNRRPLRAVTAWTLLWHS
jgi:hypothetical protein